MSRADRSLSNTLFSIVKSGSYVGKNVVLPHLSNMGHKTLKSAHHMFYVGASFLKACSATFSFIGEGFNGVANVAPEVKNTIVNGVSGVMETFSSRSFDDLNVARNSFTLAGNSGYQAATNTVDALSNMLPELVEVGKGLGNTMSNTFDAGYYTSSLLKELVMGTPIHIANTVKNLQDTSVEIPSIIIADDFLLLGETAAASTAIENGWELLGVEV